MDAYTGPTRGVRKAPSEPGAQWTRGARWPSFAPAGTLSLPPGVGFLWGPSETLSVRSHSGHCSSGGSAIKVLSVWVRSRCDSALPQGSAESPGDSAWSASLLPANKSLQTSA